MNFLFQKLEIMDFLLKTPGDFSQILGILNSQKKIEPQLYLY